MTYEKTNVALNPSSIQPRYFAMRRVSSRRQADEGMSLPEQDARLHADRNANFPGHEYVPIELAGISGGSKSDAHRAELLSRLREGDVLAAVALDRFGRSTLSVLKLVLGADERGCLVRTLRENIDTGSAVGRFLISTLAAMAQLEKDFNSDRVKSTVERRKRERDVWPGGRRPYCFTDSTRRELVASEVRVWNEEVLPRFLGGTSELLLCRELTALEIPSAGGGRWAPSAVTKQLQAPFMYGLKRQEDGTLVETGLPAPSDPEQYAQVAAIFAARAPMPERRGRESVVPAVATPKLLPATCAVCGSTMRIRARGRTETGERRGSYVCDRNVVEGPGTCPMPNVPVGAVTGALLRVFADELVDERETRRLMERAARRVTSDTRRALRDSEREEMRLRSHLNRLRREHREGELSGRRFEIEMDQAEFDLAASEAETGRLRVRVEEAEGEGALYAAERQLLDQLARIRELALQAHPSDRATLAAVATAVAQVVERVEVADTRLPHELTVPLPDAVEHAEGDAIRVPVHLIGTGLDGIVLNLVPRRERGEERHGRLDVGRVELPATIDASAR